MDRQALFEDHLDVARAISCRLMSRMPPHVTREDAVAAGMVGLWRASERYQDGQVAQFRTYLDKFVKGAVWDWCKRTREGARSKYRPGRPLSLDRCLQDPEFELADCREILDLDAAETVAVGMQCLSPREFEAVRLYYFEGRTLKDVGQTIGMTETNAHLAIKRALATMRDRLVRSCS